MSSPLSKHINKWNYSNIKSSQSMHGQNICRLSPQMQSVLLTPQREIQSQQITPITKTLYAFGEIVNSPNAYQVKHGLKVQGPTMKTNSHRKLNFKEHQENLIIQQQQPQNQQQQQQQQQLLLQQQEQQQQSQNQISNKNSNFEEHTPEFKKYQSQFSISDFFKGNQENENLNNQGFQSQRLIFSQNSLGILDFSQSNLHIGDTSQSREKESSEGIKTENQNNQ
eukprot:TRINITY_DN944_c0_g4_i1.p1 TRINITY_DN944_c0_g4~~TRINITY_DN944_c0_g4_i1.p1  ORF type:complete len:224 (-),score=35.47 TRINITY_DN944_c0_g4_i1:69-740(-)